MSFSVRAPASSANLGPGFDSLAIALDIWLHVDVERVDSGEGAMEHGTQDLLGGENLVLMAMNHTAQELGFQLPPCVVQVKSNIPVARGLGSSAAALVSGVRAAIALNGDDEPDPALVINIAGQLEGHADNVSAAVLGGVTAAVEKGSTFIAARLADSVPWRSVVFVPHTSSLTRESRGVLPDRVPLADAASNVGRAALLVHAFRLGDGRLLSEAMIDRLHQPYRADIFPHLPDAIEAGRAAGAIGVCLSGAGPTILALASDDLAASVGDAIQAASEEHGLFGDVLLPEIALAGCQVVRDRH